MIQRKRSTPRRIPKPHLCAMPNCGQLTYSKFCRDCNARIGHKVTRIPQQGELFQKEYK